MALLAVLVALVSTGCIVAEAPSYGAPRRTTPVIDHLSVEPQPSFLVRMEPTDVSKQFSFTVHSEDAGEPLFAVLVIDYNGGEDRQTVFDAVDIPARAADEPKNVTLLFEPDGSISDGCHSLTALVMHDSSRSADQLPIPIVSDGDVAAITWWIDLKTENGGVPIACPTGA
jgi:hypothetical protein